MADLCYDELFQDPDTGRLQYSKFVRISFCKYYSQRLFVPLLQSNSHVSPAYRIGRYMSTPEEKAHLIRQWIRRCDEEHGHGPSSDTESPLSIENLLVVDVWNECLVPWPGNRRYLALSYVWGKHECPGARNDNIDLLKTPKGLREWNETIPRTVVDAITLTRKLGEQYLWVDLLCIVQDDSSNKHSMISSMDRIFLQASLTIIAVTGENANSGLFVSDPEGFRKGERITEELTLIPIKDYRSLSTQINWCLQGRAWT